MLAHIIHAWSIAGLETCTGRVTNEDTPIHSVVSVDEDDTQWLWERMRPAPNAI